MASRNPFHRIQRRASSLAWAAVTALALVAFMVAVDDAGRSPALQDATRVVPAQK